jgi:hypothetical protein
LRWGCSRAGVTTSNCCRGKAQATLRLPRRAISPLPRRAIRLLLRRAISPLPRRAIRLLLRRAISPLRRAIRLLPILQRPHRATRRARARRRRPTAHAWEMEPPARWAPNAALRGARQAFACKSARANRPARHARRARRAAAADASPCSARRIVCVLIIANPMATRVRARSIAARWAAMPEHAEPLSAEPTTRNASRAPTAARRSARRRQDIVRETVPIQFVAPRANDAAEAKALAAASATPPSGCAFLALALACPWVPYACKISTAAVALAPSRRVA